MNWIITDELGEVVCASPTALKIFKKDIPANIREMCSECPQKGKSQMLADKILTFGGLKYQPTPYIDSGQDRILWQTVETDTIARLEQLLSNERNFFDLVFNNIDSDIAIFDSQHRYRYVNKHGIADAGLRKWIIGKDDFDYCTYRNVPSTKAFERRRRFEEALANTEPVTWTDRYVLKDDSEQFVERTFHPIFIDGKVKYVVGIGRDITSHVLLNKALQKSKEKYERLFHENIAGLFKSDLNGTFIEINEAFAATFGYTKAELTNLSSKVLYPSEKSRTQYLNDLIDLGTLENYTLYLKNKLGEDITVLANIRYTPGSEPGTGTIQGALLNVTEERKAYKTINWLSSLAKESPDPIVRLDGKNGRVLFMNVAAEKAFSGMDHHAILTEMYQQSIANDGVRSEHSMEIGDSWYMVRCVKINSENPYINFYFTDITDEKLMIKELSRSLKELNQRNENLKQFNFIVSHNLRAPISNLIGLVSLAKTKYETLPSGLAQIFEHIASSSENLDKVIIDLNKLLEVQSANETSDRFSIRTCIENVVAILQPEIDAVKAELTVIVNGEDLLVSIQSYIQSILHNLLSNALKYRDQNRTLTIEVIIENGPKGTEFLIRDNGIGFDANGSDVFQPFRRQHFHVEGKGLGLSMVKAQIDQLNGRVEVISEPDEGSSFFIVIPPHTPDD